MIVELLTEHHLEFLSLKGTPTTRVCAIFRTPFGCYENLIRSDLCIYSSRRSEGGCTGSSESTLVKIPHC